MPIDTAVPAISVCTELYSRILFSVARLGDELGSGAGKGGGGGGSIREAGGAFGRKEAAIEEQYFRKLVGILFYFSCSLLRPFVMRLCLSLASGTT